MCWFVVVCFGLGNLLALKFFFLRQTLLVPSSATRSRPLCHACMCVLYLYFPLNARSLLWQSNKLFSKNLAEATALSARTHMKTNGLGRSPASCYSGDTTKVKDVTVKWRERNCPRSSRRNKKYQQRIAAEEWSWRGNCIFLFVSLRHSCLGALLRGD